MHYSIIGDVAASQATGSGWQMLAIYGLLFAGMWFLLVMPQRKRQKDQQKMINSLRAGDKILMSSGMVGTIVNVKGNKFIVKIADDVKVELFKSYVLSKLNKEK